jgi:hypothetical protein
LYVADSAPRLLSISPSSGPAGIAYPLRATIRGNGFDPVHNTVQFGRATIADLPATQQGEITFEVPKSLRTGGEVPPLVFPPGEYQVTVTTPAGTSNALTFSLMRGP